MKVTNEHVGKRIRRRYWSQSAEVLCVGESFIFVRYDDGVEEAITNGSFELAWGTVKPSARIGEILTSFPKGIYQQSSLEGVQKAIIQYLDEQFEAKK